MSNIFISYRRDDSAAACGRIYERLASHFGKGTVFKDVDDLPFGVRFPDYLAEQLRGCRIELVMIGRYWLTLMAPGGTRRLDVPGDFVRTEIEMGLRDGLIVVPILVDNASMPHPEDLPESIRELVEYHGAQVRNDPEFNADMERLIRQLGRWLGVTSPAVVVGASTSQPQSTAPAPADPQVALVAQLLPGLRAAAASHDWRLVLEKADYLASAVSTAAVPAEVWRLIGEACKGVGDFTRSSASFKSALALVDAPTERVTLLHDYIAALGALKQWDEVLRRTEEGSQLASDDPFWPRMRLHAFIEIHRDADALALARTLTARPDATARDWLTRARLVRALDGQSEAANAEVRSALDAAARRAGSNDAAVAHARRELSPVQVPKRLASLGFVLGIGTHFQIGNNVAFIVPPTVQVPAGSFLMGNMNMSAYPRDLKALYDGQPRTVDVPAFAIARYPVTVAEYACFVRAGQREPYGGAFGMDWQTQLTRLDHPVTCVSWQDATAYAVWFARLSGQPWRLPTEEEWEKAASWDPRSGKSMVYPWGDTFDTARCNTSESGIGTTTLVGTYGTAGASPVGAEDMAGNVSEWVSSPRGRSTDHYKLRGGSFEDDGRHARADCHGELLRPRFSDVDNGFRLVMAPARAGS